MTNEGEVTQYRDEAIHETVNLIIEELQEPIKSYVKELKNEMLHHSNNYLKTLISPIDRKLNKFLEDFKNTRSLLEKNQEQIEEFNKKQSRLNSKISKTNTLYSIFLIIISGLAIANLILTLR